MARPTLTTLTTEQLQNLFDAIGDRKDWPKTTDDPRVNYVVDCLVMGNDTPPFDQQLYAAEAEAFRARAQSV